MSASQIVSEQASQPFPPNFVRDAVLHADQTDSFFDMLEERIAALEAALAAPGLRRLWALWMLGTQLRRAVQPYPGEVFKEKRLEQVTVEWCGE